jgi:hypothetical protein
MVVPNRLRNTFQVHPVQAHLAMNIKSQKISGRMFLGFSRRFAGANPRMRLGTFILQNRYRKPTRMAFIPSFISPKNLFAPDR